MHRPLTTFLLLLTAATTASADWVLESHIDKGPLGVDAVTKIKGDKVRMDMTMPPAGNITIILEPSKDSMVQIMHAQKAAMKSRFSQMQELMKKSREALGKKDDDPQPKPTSTGKTEKFGGFDCEIWAHTDPNSTFKYWVAKDHPQATALKEASKQMRSISASLTPSGPDLGVLSGPVLKTEVSTMGQSFVMTIKSIKEAKLADADFEVPADIKVMEMPSSK